jgi:hypothetical protein
MLLATTHNLQETPASIPSTREAVMTDANLFQKFAQEALQQASKAKSEQEKQALQELALTWVNAALASDRVFGSGWTPTEPIH